MLIYKIPLINGLGKTRGCELAPDKIIAQIKNIYSNESRRELAFSEKLIEVNNQNVEESMENIYSGAAKIFSSPSLDRERAIFLGGDHSISYPLTKAFYNQFRNSCIIVLDAHADSMHNFSPPTHEDWIRTLVEKEGFPAGNLLLAGLRNVHKIESDFLIRNHVNCFDMREIFLNIQETCDNITETARAFDAAYLSIDIDAADSSIVPGTGYPEPAGLSAREMVYIIQRLSSLKNLKAADIVEVNPVKDINDMTSKLAAKILTELS